MFIEPISQPHNKGWIEVVCGSMFSGKTEELIRRLKRAQIAKKKVEIFKPAIDTRYHDTDVVSHNNNSIRSTPVENSQSILLLVGDNEVVGIDEAQFLDNSLPEVCEQLAKRGIRVIIAGLDMDFEGKPFGPIPNLLSIADHITKVQAICVQCGDIAHFSYRLHASEAKVLLGEKDLYEPRCRSCYYKGKNV
ncbi:MAG: thymidine kinase [Chitinophagales bacterium]|nr:thymidine kinase [Chitinophagales bacterium]MCO5280686.1 thymidine kinase [Chitinophagales bacterium]OJV30857.1 MAG: thymidine kinase [Bacteroidetes bacterium 37-13]HRN93443.1 thymidine kinase [Chitinophagales bacterium]HRP39194.1 thymidine kinase [Chitinophagales bacterium]